MDSTPTTVWARFHPDTAPRDRWILIATHRTPEQPPLFIPTKYHPSGGWTVDPLAEPEWWTDITPNFCVVTEGQGKAKGIAGQGLRRLVQP